MRNHFIVCACNSSEHTVRFVDDGEDFFIEVQLNQNKNILHRILAAVKYVLGFKCKFGHWDCTLITDEEARKLKTFLNRF